MLKNGIWEKSAGNLLFGKNVGIIGTGRIGKSVAELISKMGSKIFAFDVAPDQTWADMNSVKYLSFEKLLSGKYNSKHFSKLNEFAECF